MVKKSDLEKIGVRLSFHRDLLLRKIKELQNSSCSNNYNIVLRTIEGKMTTFCLTPNLTIDQLKVKVEKDWLGLAASNQHLVVAGKELISGTLKSANITSGAIIFVIPTSSPKKEEEEEEEEKAFKPSLNLKFLEIPVKLHITRTGEEFDLMLNGNSTVLSVLQLAAKFATPTPQQQLIHNVRFLDDVSATVIECGVKAGDRLYLVRS